jgi:hypothetical protein
LDVQKRAEWSLPPGHHHHPHHHHPSHHLPKDTITEVALTTGRSNALVLSSSSDDEHYVAVLGTDGVNMELKASCTGHGQLATRVYQSSSSNLVFAYLNPVGSQVPDFATVSGPSASQSILFGQSLGDEDANNGSSKTTCETDPSKLDLHDVGKQL